MASKTFASIKFVFALIILCSFQQYLTSARTLEKDDNLSSKTMMQSSKKGHKFHTTSHYSFFSGNPTWKKYDVTYAFGSNVPLPFRPSITSAFGTWASVSQFKFNEVQDFESAEIKIEFLKGDHGDGDPFDGREKVLAHGFCVGNLHFDAEENWTIGDAQENGLDVQSIALHEIGHVLCLDHSSVKGAIMSPGYAPGDIKRILQDDDIQGLKALYQL